MINIKSYYKDDCYNVYLETSNSCYKKNGKWIQDLLHKDDLVQIKKHEYQELLNLYFSKSKETWEFQGELFKKLDNFEVNTYKNVWKNNEYWFLNYKDIPYHEFGFTSGHIVYYQGKLYVANINGNYFPRTMLFKLNYKFPDKIKWTNLKNCAPVFNINKKEII